MPIDAKFKQLLKSKAHALKPIILIGENGLTPAVIKETERALNDHELIKIRIQSMERDKRKQLFFDITETLHAELIQIIGNIAVIYRKNDEKK